MVGSPFMVKLRTNDRVSIPRAVENRRKEAERGKKKTVREDEEREKKKNCRCSKSGYEFGENESRG